MIKRIVWGVLTAACAALILFFSLQTVQGSMHLSGAITDEILTHDSAYQQLSSAQQTVKNDKIHDQLRSLAHVCTFMALAFCASRFVCAFPKKQWHVALLSCMAFAVLDECVQQLHGVGRTFEIKDILCDWSGIVIGTVISLALLWVWRSIKSKGQQHHGISSTGSGQLN